MVTDKQLEANCQNALQSTGPRVPGRAEAKLEDKRFMNLSGVDSWNRVGSWYDLNRGNVSPPVGPQSQRVATIPASPVSRRWRRYLRFSVRGTDRPGSGHRRGTGMDGPPGSRPTRCCSCDQERGWIGEV